MSEKISPQEVASNIKANTDKIKEAAKTLYNLLPDGSSIKVEWICQPSLIAPGQVLGRKTLVVSKPVIDLVMTSKEE